MASRVEEIDDENKFNEHVTRAPPSQLILVDFFALWCGPCRMIAPTLMELSRKYLNVVFLSVDVDKCRNIAARYGIEAMPTFLFIKNKDVVDTIRGANAMALERRIQELMGSSFQLETDPKRIAVGRSFPCFQDLLQNSPELFDATSNILVRYANNILRDQNNLKYRQIQLGNEVFMNKLLPILGAVDCLFAMGFQEMDDRLLLPPASSLDNLHSIRDALQDERDSRKGHTKLSTSKTKNATVTCTSGIQNITVSKRALKYQPKLQTTEEIQLFQRIKSTVDMVMLYEEEELQELARAKIPVDKLTSDAEVKSQTTTDENGVCLVSKNDCLLLLLLGWFKNEFFTWTNSPKCKQCGTETVNNGIVEPNEEERRWNAGTVENYQCPKCYSNERFPRYNHPQKLLETRTGRCGEWANCFTLCCRAIGFEARFVSDWTDHVWTEVYSHSKERWLHCDACENICDTPLIYESGWGKKLSYIIAFSKDQIIDVTWRYSNKHADIIRRRTKVSENWLFNVCTKSTEELQYGISPEEQKMLLERSTVELVEFISPKLDITEEEKEGRLSGSLAWRQLRGETNGKNSTKTTMFKFEPTKESVDKKRLRIRYDVIKDCYYTCLNDEITEASTKIVGWQNGTERHENIFRKVEHDWKMVYLARTEGSESGSISWLIDLHETDLFVSNVNIQLRTKTYENGLVTAHLFDAEKSCAEGINVSNSLVTSAFHGTRSLRLVVEMKYGCGDVAWQHAQLFRTSETSEDTIALEIDVSLNCTI